MRAPRTCLWSALLWLLTLQPISAQYGSSYLGCFSFSRMLYLKGVEGVKVSMRVVPTDTQLLRQLTTQPTTAALAALDAPGNPAHTGDNRQLLCGLPETRSLTQHRRH
jgi:hypothetical protein